jgi:Family of unknown function (DUF5675)
MNNINITRLDSSDAGVFGKILLDWDDWQGVTLERMTVEIPTGTYGLAWHVSEHLGGAKVPMLLDVPNRSYILLHWGNTQNCSDGCILIGTQRDGDAIDSTKAACKMLFSLIDSVGIDTCLLTIS